MRAPQCVVCGDRLAGAQLLMGDGRCVNCRDFEPEFARAVSFAEYEGGLRGLIHLLKYDAVLPVAPVLGGMLADAIRELLPSCGDSLPLVVPVPLHKSKRGDRGFNQAELIARAAVKRLPQPVGAGDRSAGSPARDHLAGGTDTRTARQRMCAMRFGCAIAGRCAVAPSSWWMT